MPLGAGFSPAGLTPYGYGTPDQAPEPGGKALRNALTGQPVEARRIDARSRDYVFDAFGRIEGMSSGQQAIYLAYATERRSSAVRELGNRLRDVKVITANFARQVEDILREAAAVAVAAGLVEILDVTVVRRGTSGAVSQVRWVDKTTGREQTSEVT